MRLTVNLDEDLYRVAKSISVAEDCSISVAINKLMRRTFQPAQRRADMRKRGRFPVVKCRDGGIITSAEVASLDHEDDSR